MTKDEYLRLPEAPPGERLELLDGEIVPLNPPTRRHQYVSLILSSSLLAWTQAEPGRGRVLPEIGADAGPATVLIPDLQWFAPDRELPPFDGPVWPVGDLVAEVLSTSTARYDLDVKRARYLATGAREVWLVDPVAMTVEIHRPAGDPVLLGPDDTLTSPLLPGFELPLARLRVD